MQSEQADKSNGRAPNHTRRSYNLSNKAKRAIERLQAAMEAPSLSAAVEYAVVEMACIAELLRDYPAECRPQLALVIEVDGTLGIERIISQAQIAPER